MPVPQAWHFATEPPDKAGALPRMLPPGMDVGVKPPIGVGLGIALVVDIGCLMETIELCAE